MTETAKNSENITLFPIQIRETNDTSSDAETILQCKLVWAKTLNMIASGEIVPTEIEKARYRKALDEVNGIFLKLGHSPIYYGF